MLGVEISHAIERHCEAILFEVKAELHPSYVLQARPPLSVSKSSVLSYVLALCIVSMRLSFECSCSRLARI